MKNINKYILVLLLCNVITSLSQTYNTGAYRCIKNSNRYNHNVRISDDLIKQLHGNELLSKSNYSLYNSIEGMKINDSTIVVYLIDSNQSYNFFTISQKSNNIIKISDLSVQLEHYFNIKSTELRNLYVVDSSNQDYRTEYCGLFYDDNCIYAIVNIIDVFRSVGALILKFSPDSFGKYYQSQVESYKEISFECSNTYKKNKETLEFYCYESKNYFNFCSIFNFLPLKNKPMKWKQHIIVRYCYYLNTALDIKNIISLE